jgi:hypothetical membrane protein
MQRRMLGSSESRTHVTVHLYTFLSSFTGSIILGPRFLKRSTSLVAQVIVTSIGVTRRPLSGRGVR